jgi:hypothetical protein
MGASATSSNRRVRTRRTVVWQVSEGDLRPYADLVGNPELIARNIKR